MAYQISRNGQMYGPYTIEDLERYLSSGHVLPNDLCKSEEMTDWRPVSEVLAAAGRAPASTAGAQGQSSSAVYPPTAAPFQGNYPPSAYTAGAPAASYAASAATLQPPPNLHWGLVLLFDVLTCSLFQMVWNIVLGAWFHRIAAMSKTLFLYIAAAVLLICQGVGGQAMGLMAGHNAGVHMYTYNYGRHPGFFGLYALIALATWVVRLLARFNFRSELELHYNTVEPIGLQINPVLLFFFGGIYLQSVMNRINETRRIMAYSTMPR